MSGATVVALEAVWQDDADLLRRNGEHEWRASWEAWADYRRQDAERTV